MKVEINIVRKDGTKQTLKETFASTKLIQGLKKMAKAIEGIKDSHPARVKDAIKDNIKSNYINIMASFINEDKLEAKIEVNTSKIADYTTAINNSVDTINAVNDKKIINDMNSIFQTNTKALEKATKKMQKLQKKQKFVAFAKNQKQQLLDLMAANKKKKIKGTVSDAEIIKAFEDKYNDFTKVEEKVIEPASPTFTQVNVHTPEAKKEEPVNKPSIDTDWFNRKVEEKPVEINKPVGPTFTSIEEHKPEVKKEEPNNRQVFETKVPETKKSEELDIDKVKSAIFTAFEENATLKTDVSNLNNKNAELEAKLARLTEQLNTKISTEDSFKATISKYEATDKEHLKQIEEIKAEMDSYKLGHQAEKDKLQKELDKLVADRIKQAEKEAKISEIYKEVLKFASNSQSQNQAQETSSKQI